MLPISAMKPESIILDAVKATQALKAMPAEQQVETINKVTASTASGAVMGYGLWKAVILTAYITGAPVSVPATLGVCAVGAGVGCLKGIYDVYKAKGN
jgi:hypothetical protein